MKPVFLMSAAFLLSCGHAPADNTLAGPIGGRCNNGEVISRSLKVRPVDASALGFSASELPSTVRLNSAAILKGDCLNAIAGYEAGILLFKESLALQQGVDGSYKVMARFPEALMQHDLRSPAGNGVSKKLSYGNRIFVMAALVDRIQRPTGNIENYVGLWQGNGAAYIGAFQRTSDGNFGQPKEVLKISRNFDTLNYFPSPDTTSGEIGLTNIDDGEALLVSLGWSHGKIFK